jgi:signal transduction histidine kinase
MRQARALLDEMQAEEDRLLQERLATVQRQEWMARAMLAVLTVSGASLLVGLHLAMARGERRLRDSEELVRSLVDNAPALVRLRTPDGRPKLENRPYQGMRQTHEADAAWLDAQLARLETQALSSGAPVSEALAQPGAEGARHFQGASFPVQGDDGSVLGVGSILTDVSALERARAELQQLTETLEEQVRQRTARLTEANAELEAFSYMVSHDLRAPLRAVQGFAQALAEDAGPLLGEENRGFIDRIDHAAQRMDRLIEDLLAYGRLSRAEISSTPVPLQAALEEALQWLGPQLQASGAQVQVAPSMPAVSAHPAVLGQVLQNLLANAFKFVAPGVRPRVVVSAERRAGGWVRMTVQDNGIGIEPEDQDRIFTPFERLHGAERYAGSGIGLAIVKRGIERLGGRVGLASRAGEGSSFWFELREAAPDAIPQRLNQQAPAAATGSPLP